MLWPAPLIGYAMSASEVDVLIVGGGIAGWSAAYFAARAARQVTLVDAGIHRASDLPVALVNPLRGKAGRLVPRGIEGMRATFALIDALRDAGHRIEQGRGLFRPLIDVGLPAHQREYWKARLPEACAFEWRDAAPPSLGLAQPVPALYLPEAGWVAPRGLLDALRIASRATLLEEEALAIEVDPRTRAGVVSLAGGSRLAARSLLWCGGAWGASRLDCEGDDRTDGDAIYKPGCLVVMPGTLTRDAMSFGLYAIPLPDGSTLVGPTREPSQPGFPDDGIPGIPVARLQDRVAQVFGTRVKPSSIWRGVRLVHPSAAVAQRLRDVASITSLGSRGFLMAPLLASEWALSL